jgi:hypothetical protein
MTYSLMEPLQSAGFTIADLGAMTGLPEYRNGGLLVDLGLLVPKHAGVLLESHAPDSQVCCSEGAGRRAQGAGRRVSVRCMGALPGPDTPSTHTLPSAPCGDSRCSTSCRSATLLVHPRLHPPVQYFSVCAWLWCGVLRCVVVRCTLVCVRGGQVIVEWRALTVAALDVIVGELRTRLGVDAATFPLVKVRAWSVRV